MSPARPFAHGKGLLPSFTGVQRETPGKGRLVGRSVRGEAGTDQLQDQAAGGEEGKQATTPRDYFRGCCLGCGGKELPPWLRWGSISWRNGATAYKGNKERQRRRIFICPSSHSEGRCFIMGVGCEITLLQTPNTESLCLGGREDDKGFLGTTAPWGHSLPSCRAKLAAAQSPGGGRGVAGQPRCRHRPVPRLPLWLREDEQKFTFSRLGLICKGPGRTAEPLLCAGDGRGGRRTETDSIPV